MGISGCDFLPRVMELSGLDIDLRHYKDGILLPSSKSTSTSTSTSISAASTITGKGRSKWNT